VVAGLCIAAVGTLSLVSALTPDVPWRRHLLLAAEPGPVMKLGHVLAAAGGLALIYVGWSTLRRRRRAANISIGALVALAFVHAAKGLDYEESALALSLAALLWSVRRSCTHGGAPGKAWIAAMVAVAAVATAYALNVATLLNARPALGLGQAFHGAASALADGAWWLRSGEPGAVALDALLVIAVLAAGAFLHSLLRPAQATNGHSPEDHRRAAKILLRHGRDSLDPFALREEKTFFFSRGGMLAYRTLRGTAVVSGDPIGPPGEGAGIVEDFLRFAADRGWEVVLTAASERLLPDYGGLGLHAVCIGEEAVVNPAEFSLEGRSIRKVRQSLHRAERQGWTLAVVAGVQPASELARELAAVEAHWRAGRTRLYGFAMSLGRLWGSPEDTTAVYALARAPGGELRTFVRFARCADLLSLDVMRRSGGEPNGMNEALIARTLEWARDQQVSEVSLNFAGFAHIMAARTDANRLQPLMRRALELVHGRFQLERLMAFNNKFDPTWRRRFLVYGGHTYLPLAALRVLQAEAYIRPPRGRRARSRRWQPMTDFAGAHLPLERPGATR
jgi:lysyl-tRNA synthetase class 2